MASRVPCSSALISVALLFSGPAAAAMDMGLCPAVQEALDPNADGYFNDGDNDRAMAAAQACVAAGSPRGFTSRGYVYRRLGNVKMAMADVAQALVSGGDKFGALRLRCALASDEKRFDAARSACAEALAAAPNQAAPHFGLAMIGYTSGDHASALPEIDRAIALAPDDAVLWSTKALILTQLQRHAEALDAANRASRLAPTVFEPESIAGTALMNLKRNDEAVTRLTRAIAVARTDDERATGYWGRGRANEFNGDKNAAFADYDRATTLSAKWAQPVWDRGTIKTDRKDFRGAIADFDRAIELDPKFADAYLSRGIANKELGNHRTALSDLKRAIALNPSSAEAYFQLGYVDGKLGNPTEIEDYTRAIEIDPSMAMAWNNRGFAYYNVGKKAEALSDYNRALALDNTMQSALFWRARTHAEMGNAESAIGDYSRLLQVNPGYLWAYYNRGDLLLQRALAANSSGKSGANADFAAAFRDFDALVDKDPNRDMGTVWTKWAMSGMGEHRDAVAMLAKINRLWEPSVEQADKYVARAGLHYATRNNAAALADARRALALDAGNKNAMDLVTELTGSPPPTPAEVAARRIPPPVDPVAREKAPKFRFDAPSANWQVEVSDYGQAATIEADGQIFALMCLDGQDCGFHFDYGDGQACKDRAAMSVFVKLPNGQQFTMDNTRCNLVAEENRTYIEFPDDKHMRRLLETNPSVSFSIFQNGKEVRTPSFGLRGAKAAMDRVREATGND